MSTAKARTPRQPPEEDIDQPGAVEGDTLPGALFTTPSVDPAKPPPMTGTDAGPSHARPRSCQLLARNAPTVKHGKGVGPQDDAGPDRGDGHGLFEQRDPRLGHPDPLHKLPRRRGHHDRAH